MRKIIIELPYTGSLREGHGLSILKSKHLRSDNSTGTKGVYRRGNRYVAKIVVAGKQIQLGTFPSIEAATKARENIDKQISSSIIPAYSSWKVSADKDPAWATENPFRIHILQKKGQLPKLTCNFPLHWFPYPCPAGRRPLPACYLLNLLI